MKKMLSMACLLACTVFSSGTSLPVAAGANSIESESITLNLNGQAVTWSAKPQLINNTLMVPLRDLSDALDAEVQWDNSNQTATVRKENLHIALTLGSVQATRQDYPYTLDMAPRMEAGKLFVPLRFFSESFDFNVFWDGPNQTVSIVDANNSLPTVGTLEHLQELLKDTSSSAFAVSGGAFVTMDQAATSIRVPLAAMKTKEASSDATASAASESKPAYSGTNVQVEGVDEADIIKTDGKYIYQVNQNRIIITEAYPADQMKIVQTLHFEDTNYRPQELFIDDKHMVVIGTTMYPLHISKEATVEESASATAVQPKDTSPTAKKIVVPIRPTRSTTKAIVYDLGDRSSTLKKIREVELEGSYVSSRKVGASLYLVANKRFNISPLLRTNTVAAGESTQPDPVSNIAPAYKDSVVGDTFISMGYDNIRYFPQSVDSNYLMIGGLNLEQPSQQMKVSSYLGSGNQVYASEKHLYVTTLEYAPMPAVAKEDPSSKRRLAPSEQNSVIYKFGLDEGNIRYEGRGKVPGRSINQFAMDENNGYFRIATTINQLDSSGRYVTTNNLFVLDEALKTVGTIEDIAPGEQIYSVRYTGNRAYMVTFRTVDPLFVIDLSQPQAPQILGKLKIPGYSNYLHPYDDTHLIGFGKDTVEVSNDTMQTGSPQTTAYYQGMKMALFDVSDVEHPKELFNDNIGDRGTDSELLNNHKALLFSKEKSLLAFPVNVMEIDKSSRSNVPKGNAATRYGQFTFQGAYVYQLDLTKGFSLKGKITHLTKEDYDKSSQFGAAYERSIHRILSIGDTLYTSSDQVLKATQLSNFEDVGSIQIP